MAKLGAVKRISKEDLGSADIPGFVDPLLDSLNVFISSVTSALQGRLTFSDNFLSTVKSLKFTSGVEQKVSTNSRFRASGVVPIYSTKPISSFYWEQKEDGSIGITFTFTGGGDATCRILILFGDS